VVVAFFNNARDRGKSVRGKKRNFGSERNESCHESIVIKHCGRRRRRRVREKDDDDDVTEARKGKQASGKHSHAATVAS